MGESKEHDKLKETFIFILLFALIVLRLFPIGEDNTFIKSVGHIGVLFALVCHLARQPPDQNPGTRHREIPLISQGLIPRSLLRKKLFCKVKR